MGIQEALACANLGDRREKALDEGELDPDARTFAVARRRFVQHWLATAQPVFEGRAPREAGRGVRVADGRLTPRRPLHWISCLQMRRPGGHRVRGVRR